MTLALFDTNIYDRIASDVAARTRICDLVASGSLRVVATPMVVREVSRGPLGGLPGWFPIGVEPESVAVIGFAEIGMARIGDGAVYSAHRGSSNQIEDGIIADSASALADILVSEDARCRRRLAERGARCEPMSWIQFREWLMGGS